MSEEYKVLKSCGHYALMTTATGKEYDQMSDGEKLFLILIENKFKAEPCIICKNGGPTSAFNPSFISL